jgi:DNA invertase Pin-like site-specific DNA recombinase
VKLMLALKPGDDVVVTKLDRLRRSTRELLDLIEQIGAAGATFRSLGDPLFDTSSSQGRLLVAVLAAIASFERDLIRERTSEGRKRAMAEGRMFGRKPKLTPHQRAEALKRRAAGETIGRDRQELRRRHQHDLAPQSLSATWPLEEAEERLKELEK